MFEVLGFAMASIAEIWVENQRAQSIMVPHAHYDSAICRRWREIHHGIS
jgi:hypothetical protein